MAFETDRQLDVAPFRKASGGLRTLALTEADASITLAQGYYQLYLDGTIDAVVCLGDTAAVPASGDPEAAGTFVLPAGAVATIEVVGASDTALHALLVSTGSATLYLTRVAP